MRKILQIAFAFILILDIVCICLIMGSKNENKTVPVATEEAIAVNEMSTENYDEDKKELESQINTIISDKKGIWSVYVKNLETGMTVEINNREFIAASVIKLYNMITLYDEAKEGNVRLTDSILESLEQMITVSSNEASNAVVTTIGNGSFSDGAKKVNQLADEMGCENTYEQHMLYDDYAPPTGRNRTSVRDCGIVLEKIYSKQCISLEYDEKMLELLKQQTLDFKIPANLPDDVVVANKTGENSNVEADVGIVFSPECDYIICISVEKYGEKKPRDTISEVSECVYNFFNAE